MLVAYSPIMGVWKNGAIMASSGHPSKDESTMDINPAGKYIYFKKWHLPKASFPIFVKVDGSSIDASAVHFSKALSPRDIKLGGSAIAISDLHSEKTSISIDTKLGERVTIASDVHL